METLQAGYVLKMAFESAVLVSRTMALSSVDFDTTKNVPNHRMDNISHLPIELCSEDLVQAKNDGDLEESQGPEYRDCMWFIT
jgi:hypothetical protein